MIDIIFITFILPSNLLFFYGIENSFFIFLFLINRGIIKKLVNKSVFELIAKLVQNF